MHHFSHLVLQLDQTNKTNAKIAALVNYLEVAEDEDKLWAIAMFSGRRPRRNVKATQLREWASEWSGIPLWLLEESYHIVGDLAETLAHILPPPDKDREEKSLTEWILFLMEMKNMEEDEKREHMYNAWRKLSANERFVFNKLITGGFRLGVSQKLMLRALSQHTGMDTNAIAHRLMGNWSPQTTTYQELLFSKNIRDDISKPYPFYLAYPLDDEPQSLGEISDWQAEWKWDGIRSQFIKRKGECFLWSRGEELITDRFPELSELIPHLPDGIVIDGELLPFKNGRPMSFQHLQTRIGRKKVSKKLLQSTPVLIMAYDLLEWEGMDIRSRSLFERRLKLSQLVKQADQPERLKLSTEVMAHSWEELGAKRKKAREMDSEGLMLKHRHSDYKTGRKRGDWWKWKVDPLTIDAVMIYAQRGHGRRANLFSDYTFAVWDEDRLVPFAKAYSGLTDAEMRQVDSWIKRNTVERFGPVRSVKPELVFEIGFEGINRSKRHKSGVALRFPRMLRWRKDKAVGEANSLQDLLRFLKE